MRYRALKWLIVALLAGLLASLAAAVWVAGRGLPVREGRLSLAALGAPVTVRWDAWGVPHLAGASGRDLAAVMGYLHANDRMTQLELGRRMAAGRLAEVVGEAALELDVEARRLGLRRAAEAMWRRAGAESRAWLEAYAAGVNAWLAARESDLPPTLTLLGIDPEPWTPVDSLGFVLVMARDLSFWQGRPEERRFTWLGRLGAPAVRELLGAPTLHVPPATAALAARAAAAPGGDPPAASAAPGSNAWALGRSRSAEGAPLLANDPHLALRLPGTWYQVQLRAPDYEVAGMSLPGLPVVVIGQSARLAWGMTALMLDDHDLFLEELDAAGARVRRGERWQALETREETIAVRGGAPRRIVLQATGHGSLLPAEAGLPPRSLAWSAYANGDAMVPFLHLARAADVDVVSAGLDGFVGPAQNLLVADRDGGLLYTVFGHLPLRRRGDGRLPVPAADAAYGWDGTRPASGFARLRPAGELLVSANDAGSLGGAAPTADFDLPARAGRIRSLLGARARWRAEELAAVQADVVSDYARELVALCAGRYEGAARRAHDALAAWDGRMAARGTAALFALFERELERAVFADELAPAELSGLERRGWLLRVLRGEMDAAWFDDRRTGSVIEGRRDVLARALAAAWEEGRARWGADPAAWDYGALHRLTLRHPLGSLPLIGALFDRGPFALPGSPTTVAAFGSRWKTDRDEIGYGASMRWVAVAGDGDRSLAGLPGGQSGHPFDRHYDDQLEDFLAGRLHAVNWSEAQIARATVSTLVLTP